MWRWRCDFFLMKRSILERKLGGSKNIEESLARYHITVMFLKMVVFVPWHDQFSWKKIRDYGRLWKNRGCSPVESKPQEERERRLRERRND